MRRLFLGLLSVVACTQGGGGGGNAPQARPVVTPKPCPWSGGGVTTDGDLSESVNVSILLVERDGKDTTVMVDRVLDSRAGIFTSLPEGTSFLLRAYEQKLLRQFGFADAPGTFTRELSLSSSGECDDEARPVLTQLTFRDGEYDAQPKALGFATVAIGSASTQFVALINDSNGSVVFELSVPPGPFAIEGALRLTVPARGRQLAQLNFKPIATGSASSTLTVKAGANFQKLIPLQGTEGGGRIVATPSPVDFGVVAYFPQAPASSSKSRYVVLENVGSELPDGGGTFEFPGWPDRELYFNTSNNGPSPFTVKTYWSSGAPWTDGGFLLRPGDSATVRIDLTATTTGRFSSTLSLGSGARMTLVGDGQLLAPCMLTASPSPLSVPLDGGVTSFALMNAGAELCQVHSFRLEQSAAWFELLEDLNLDATLDAGATLNVRVRATATAFGDAGAKVRFNSSSDTTPNQSMALIAVP